MGAFENILSLQMEETTSSRRKENFEIYLQGIVREWVQVLTIMSAILIPLFFLLDYYTHPPQLHVRFAIYRAITTFLVLLDYLAVRFIRFGKYFPLNGYLISVIISLMIVLMTVDLGGFNSSYYAGLILVVMAVNMLLSWHPVHSLNNGLLVIFIYIGFNTLIPHAFDNRILINNLYFLGSAVIITVAISWVRFKLVRSEYLLRAELLDTNRDLDASKVEILHARDALWGEMQLAKMIQTALLPEKTEFGQYEVASLMLPTDAVGGDYYDLIETHCGERWVGIGDVSGHGVDSGLIMMMAQTAIQTIVNQKAGLRPSEVLGQANRIIKENIARLGSDRYMSALIFRLESDHVLAAGKHTDILIYRARTRKVESMSTNGSWLGIADDLGSVLEDHRITVAPGDILLLYTDGITEAQSEQGEIFGEEKLIRTFENNAHLPLRKLGNAVYNSVLQFQKNQMDDITFLLLRNKG